MGTKEHLSSPTVVMQSSRTFKRRAATNDKIFDSFDSSVTNVLSRIFDHSTDQLIILQKTPSNEHDAHHDGGVDSAALVATLLRPFSTLTIKNVSCM